MSDITKQDVIDMIQEEQLLKRIAQLDKLHARIAKKAIKENYKDRAEEKHLLLMIFMGCDSGRQKSKQFRKRKYKFRNN